LTTSEKTRLQIAREEAGMTVQQLATKADVAETVIRNAEGRRATRFRTNRECAEKIATALGRPLTALFNPEHDISNKGNPGHNGHREQRQAESPVEVCQGCYMQLPTSGVCCD